MHGSGLMRFAVLMKWCQVLCFALGAITLIALPDNQPLSLRRLATLLIVGFLHCVGTLVGMLGYSCARDAAELLARPMYINGRWRILQEKALERFEKIEQYSRRCVRITLWMLFGGQAVVFLAIMLVFMARLDPVIVATVLWCLGVLPYLVLLLSRAWSTSQERKLKREEFGEFSNPKGK